MLKTFAFLLVGALLTAASGFAASVYDYTLKTIDGKPKSLSDFKGKVVLLVNVASRCGYTPQYEGLESLYKKYKDQGLVIVGVPANNFGGQEPGTNEEIKTFCKSKYGVTFPMMAKVSVKGDDKTPLYQYLTDKSANPPLRQQRTLAPTPPPKAPARKEYRASRPPPPFRTDEQAR